MQLRHTEGSAYSTKNYSASPLVPSEAYGGAIDSLESDAKSRRSAACRSICHGAKKRHIHASIPPSPIMFIVFNGLGVMFPIQSSMKKVVVASDPSKVAPLYSVALAEA